MKKEQAKIYKSLHHFATNSTSEATQSQIANLQDAFGEYQTFFSYLPNPDKVLKKAGKDIEVYEELLNDPFVKGVFTSRKAGVLLKEWNITNNDSTAENKKEIDFAKGILNNINVYEFINKALASLFYGYQVFEIIWGEEGDFIVPLKLVAKPQRWFNFDKDGKLLFKSKTNPNGQKVPDNKFLVVKNENSYENPYGLPIAALIYWVTVFKKGGLKFWVKFTEKYGMPILTGKYNANAFEPTEIEKLINDLSNMSQDSIIVAPDEIELELSLKTNSESVQIYEALLQYCKDEISIAFLGHTGSTQSTPGKLGNETGAITVREEIINGDIKLIESSVNQLLDMIWQINFDINNTKPVFYLFEEEDVNIDLAKRDEILTKAGVQFTKEYFMNKYNLSEEEFEVGQPQKEKTNTFEEFNDTTVESKTQDILDKNIDSFVEQSKPMIDKYLKPIKDFINNQQSFTEALKNIEDLYPKLDNSQIEEQLAARMFLANLLGRLSVEETTRERDK